MSVRNGVPKVINRFRGINDFDPPESLSEDTIIEGTNVVVMPNGAVRQLRSPKNFGDSTGISGRVLSVHAYGSPIESDVHLLFDIQNGSNVDTYSLMYDGTALDSIRTGQADARRWHRLTVGQYSYGINGAEFVQTDGEDFYRVGIDKPASAPTISAQAGGTLAIATGVTTSYAYRNSVTGHVGECSAASNSVTVGGGNGTLRVPVVASAQTGVDGIVLFLTTDGGTTRYLRVDANGDPIVAANANANIDITAAYILDTTTEETSNNDPPPTDARFMFTYGDRLVLCCWEGNTERWTFRYNASDKITLGNPTECWPALNFVALRAREERIMAGVETSIGGLVLSDKDAYILTGILTDKFGDDVQITEDIRTLGWHKGTLAPLSLRNTKFGTVWLDHESRLQLWPNGGSPVEIGREIRRQLGKVFNVDSLLSGGTADSGGMIIDSVFHDDGPEAGFYIMTVPIQNNSRNTNVFIVALYQGSGGGVQWAASPISDFNIQSLCVLPQLASKPNYVIAGVTGRVRRFLQFHETGAGYGNIDVLNIPQRSYFVIPIGNDIGNFSALHSARVDCVKYTESTEIPSVATNVLTMKIGDLNTSGLASSYIDNLRDASLFTITNESTLTQELQNNSVFTLINRYNTRSRLKFEFNVDDALCREVRKVTLMYDGKTRAI